MDSAQALFFNLQRRETVALRPTEAMDFLSELWTLHARPQEILVNANCFDERDLRRTFGAEQRLRSCSVHLHNILVVERREKSRGFSCRGASGARRRPVTPDAIKIEMPH